MGLNKTKTKDSTKRPPCVRTDLILTLLIVILVLIPSSLASQKLVQQGLDPDGAPWGPLKYAFYIFPAVFILLLIMISRFLVQFRRVSSSQLILKLVLIGSSIVWPFLWNAYNGGTPHYVSFMYGFLQRMHQDADILAIQAWLETEGTKHERFLDESDYPETVRILEPETAWLDRNDKGNNPCLKLEWGGALIGHWGLTVGPDTMPCPPCDFKMDGQYRMPLAKGAYIWFDW